MVKQVSSTSWIVTGAIAAALSAGAAVAAPMALNDGQGMSGRSAVTKAHQGCHFDNRYSPRFGYHNHSNAECRPEAARPRGFDYEPRHEGRGGHGDGQPCHYDCRYSPEFGWHNHSNAQCRPEPCRGR